jgi:hypothetical protein
MRNKKSKARLKSPGLLSISLSTFSCRLSTTQCGASVVIEYAFGFPNLIAVIPLCTSFT